MTTIKLDDALLWLAKKDKESAQLVVFDPPYAVGTPVRGREDGARLLEIIGRTDIPVVPGAVFPLCAAARKLNCGNSDTAK